MRSSRHLGAVLEAPLVRRSAATPPRELLRVHQSGANIAFPDNILQNTTNNFSEEVFYI